ncbi:MAG: M1 family metallopeptidase [Ktedonobacterales bacterium]
MNPKAYRLPHTVMPRHYAIEIDARVGVEELHGRVAIQLDITVPCTSIELHARDLQVTEATLAWEGRTLVGAVTLDPDRELAIIQMPEALSPGAATLHLRYLGRVSNGLDGMYLAINGAERMICTQCETVGARAILPCFDEPDFKARFAWQVTTSVDAVVLTNGALASVSEGADGISKTWTFVPTPPMSSYLLAVAIGNLASTPVELVNGVPLCIWTSAGREGAGQFALHYTARLLPWYEDYFAVPYHFGKLDQLAVPAFTAGAMENAGLIMSQDVLLLLDPQTASWRQEKLVAMVIAHEFAHMWFGDLVTMRWWDDIWLNEAFAEWMAFRVVDALSPDYQIWDDFRVIAGRVLETDALANTHSIYKPAETPQAIQENFDEITYTKGCAVLRMVERFLGQDVFRDGIRTYMREFAESNATGSELWRHLQSASKEPVTQIMESWILQPGHPVVQVGLATVGDTTTLHLSQRRFFSRAGADVGNEQMWYVPLVIRYRDDAGMHEMRHLLSGSSASLPLDITGKLVWCYANAGEIGFYRQQMEQRLVVELLAHRDELEPAEQLGLLRDQWALVASGTQSIGAFLDVLAVMAASDDYRIVRQVAITLGMLENFLQDAGSGQALDDFRAWVSRIFGPKLARLGYEPQPGETEGQAETRCLVLDAMTRYAHDASTIEHARAWAAREAEDPRAVDANLAPIFVRAAAEFGDDALQQRYLAIYQQRKAADASPQEIDRYVNSFSRFEQPEMVQRTFQWIGEGIFPFQSIVSIMGSMVLQPPTQMAAWGWVKSHWEYLEQVAGPLIPRLVQAMGELPAKLRPDIEAFFNEHLHGELQSSLAQALEQIEQTAELKARTRDDLLAWFMEHRSQ